MGDMGVTFEATEAGVVRTEGVAELGVSPSAFSLSYKSLSHVVPSHAQSNHKCELGKPSKICWHKNACVALRKYGWEF